MNDAERTQYHPHALSELLAPIGVPQRVVNSPITPPLVMKLEPQSPGSPSLSSKRSKYRCICVFGEVYVGRPLLQSIVDDSVDCQSLGDSSRYRHLPGAYHPCPLSRFQRVLVPAQQCIFILLTAHTHGLPNH